MGFCPELARPLGALILIAWKAGRRGRVSEEVTAVRFSAAVMVLETKKEAFPPLLCSGSLQLRCFTGCLTTTVS